MNIPNAMADEPLPEPLGSVVAQIAATQPDSVDSLAVVEALKRTPPANNVAQRAELPTHSRRRLFWTYGAVVAVALLMVTLGRLPTASALELLADALSSKRCIKMTSVFDGKTREAWIMPPTQQSATRTDEWVEHFDANAETIVTHNRKTGELVRSVRHRTEFGFVSDMVSAIIASGKGDVPETIRGMEVVSSKVKVLDGQKILTLEFKSTSQRGAAENATAIAMITIDSATGLPSQCEATRSINGEVQTIVDTWTYPEEGPGNIFALGVDPSTKLVDRVPTTEVKPLLAGIYSGRVNFDDYVAVTIISTREVPSHFGPRDIVLAAKQDERLLFARYVDATGRFRGKTRAEVAEMILANPSKFTWKPMSIVDGQTEHRFHSAGVTSVEINLPRAEFVVPSWHSIPHYAGRPPLGIGRGDVASAIASEAEGGPESCVLLQTIHGGAIPEAPSDPEVSKRIKRMAKGGYWVRADRDYLVMQQDSEFEDNQSLGFTLDTLAQSPRGFWFPIKATRPGYQSGPEVIAASYYSYHLDFQKKLPLEMYDPGSY